MYFTKEGRGAGYARNTGLRHAEEKWLLFADADDFFHEGMWEMLDQWKDTDNDIVFFNTDSVISESLQPTSKRINYIDYSNLNDLRYRFFCPIAKIIRRALVITNQVSFDEVSCSNDVMFSVKTGYLANKITVSPNVLYCATIRQNSLTKILTLDYELCRIKIKCHFNRFLTMHGLTVYRFYQFEQLKNLWTRHGLQGCLKGVFLYLSQEPMQTMVLDTKAWLRIRYYKYFRNRIAPKK